MADKKEYIERGALIEMLNNKAKTDHEMGLYNHGALTESFIRFVERQPATDVVSKGVYEQVQWERDMAMQQLEEHGIPFGGTADNVVEVVHGRWIFEHDPIKDPKKYFVRIVCSCCGLKTGQVSNFCPMCGAKMDATDNNVGDKERKDKP